MAGTLRLAGPLGWLWYYHGHFQEGRGWLERALAMDAADAHGSAPESARADVEFGLGLLLHTLGEGERGAALLGASAARRRALGDDSGSGYAESLRGGALVSLGRYDEAEGLFEELLSWWRAKVNPMMAGHALFHLGLVAFSRGDWARTHLLCQEAVTQFDATHCELDAIEPLHYLGLNACATGDLDAAAAFLAETLARLRVRRSRVDFANGFADITTLAVARGHLEEAARLFGAADTIRREGGGPFPLPARLVYEGAAETARAALGVTAWRATHGAGAALSLESALVEAEAQLTNRFQRPEHPAAARISPSSGSDERELSADMMLTRRERDVLALLCQRRTDAEIADTLFLSSRTASTHVGNILGKLGVANRREAAAFAARHGLIARTGSLDQ